PGREDRLDVHPGVGETACGLSEGARPMSEVRLDGLELLEGRTCHLERRAGTGGVTGHDRDPTTVPAGGTRDVLDVDPLRSERFGDLCERPGLVVQIDEKCVHRSDL